MSHVVLCCQTVVALVFLAAAFGKTRKPANFAEFTASVAQAGIPSALAKPAAVLVVAVEFTIPILLAMPLTTRIGAGLAILVLVAFCLVIATTMVRRSQVSCRCFGSSSTPLGPAHLVRNTLLIIAAAIAATRTVTVPTNFVELGLNLSAAVVLSCVLMRFDELVSLFRPAVYSRHPR